MRCFIGCPLPPEYQDRLGSLLRRWRGRLCSSVSWTRPGNWHLTLKFLGEVAPERLPAIRSALGSVRSAPFGFQAGGGGSFPERGRPRVLWIGVRQGGQACVTLAGVIDRTLDRLGLPRETRPFAPHLTLARIREARDEDWAGLVAELTDESWPEFTMREFVLWESELRPQGPAYRVIERYPLPFGQG